MTKVERINFDFPLNKTIEIQGKDFDKLLKLNFSGQNIKVKITLTPEEKVLFKTYQKSKELKNATGANEVVFSIETSKQVSVRSRDIIKKSSIIDKLKIYAEVNNITFTPSVLEKAKDLEEHLLIKYTFPSHTFDLVSLSVRGAKGIKGREQIDIDFSKFSDGVVAITGDNGIGKSFLVELANPFPKMITRSGPLKNFFYLKDSHKIVVYKDENNKYYKFSIFMAAHIDDGLCKYYVETSDDEGATWVSDKNCNGNLQDYNKYIEENIGSLEVFLKTAFFTKGKVKGVSDIASATKGDKIRFFAELLNTDSISVLHENVKKELKQILSDIEKLDNVEEEVEKLTKELFNKEQSKGLFENDLKEILKKIELLEEEIKSTKEKEEIFNKNFKDFQTTISAKTQAEDRYNELISHKNRLIESKKRNDYYLTNEEKIKEYKEVLKKFTPANEELINLSKKYQDKLTETASLSEEYISLNNSLEIEQHKLNSVDDKIKNAKDRFIEVDDNCPTCGAKLSAAKKASLLKVNDMVNAEIEALKTFKENQKTLVADKKKEVSKLKAKLEKAQSLRDELKKECEEKDEQLKSTKVYLDFNEEFASYESYIPVTNLERDIERISKEVEAVEMLLKNFDDIEIIDFKAKLEELETKRKSFDEERVQNLIDTGKLDTQIQQIKDTLTFTQEQKENLDKLKVEYNEYSILEKAFSNSGIQALELEAAVPDIANLTNVILQEGLGDKFSVTFNTLRQGKEKIIDDFSIDVTNHETGWIIPLDQLSEGEKIWIMQSLYFAFSIIRMNRTQFSFAVRFLDESDGALFADRRVQYLNMIQSVHTTGKARLTIMVTHSQEVKDIIEQKINL